MIANHAACAFDILRSGQLRLGCWAGLFSSRAVFYCFVLTEGWPF